MHPGSPLCSAKTEVGVRGRERQPERGTLQSAGGGSHEHRLSVGRLCDWTFLGVTLVLRHHVTLDKWQRLCTQAWAQWEGSKQLLPPFVLSSCLICIWKPLKPSTGEQRPSPGKQEMIITLPSTGGMEREGKLQDYQTTQEDSPDAGLRR